MSSGMEKLDIMEVETPDGPPANLKGVADGINRFIRYTALPIASAITIVCIVLYAIKEVEAHVAAWVVGAFCSLTSTLLTTFLCYLHLTSYTNPQQQRLIIRVILMVPVYAVDSYVGLVSYQHGSIIALIRDTYEAYVLYCFYCLMVEYLGTIESFLERLDADDKEFRHPFPFGCLGPWRVTRGLLVKWKIWVVQYMVLRPLTSLISLPLIFTGHYDEATLSFKNSYVYMFITINISVSFALTGVVYFYLVTKEYLVEHKPGYKFLAIKGIVFFAFWQGAALSVMVKFGWIKHTKEWSENEIAIGMQNLLTSIEMMFVALANYYVFTFKVYRPASGRTSLQWWAIKHAFSVTDVWHDTKSSVQDTVALASPMLLRSPRASAPPTAATGKREEGRAVAEGERGSKVK